MRLRNRYEIAFAVLVNSIALVSPRLSARAQAKIKYTRAHGPRPSPLCCLPALRRGSPTARAGSVVVGTHLRGELRIAYRRTTAARFLRDRGSFLSRYRRRLLGSGVSVIVLLRIRNSFDLSRFSCSSPFTGVSVTTTSVAIPFIGVSSTTPAIFIGVCLTTKRPPLLRFTGVPPMTRGIRLRSLRVLRSDIESRALSIDDRIDPFFDFRFRCNRLFLPIFTLCRSLFMFDIRWL